MFQSLDKKCIHWLGIRVLNGGFTSDFSPLIFTHANNPFLMNCLLEWIEAKKKKKKKTDKHTDTPNTK